jgi:hypothetical protein
MTVAVAGIIMLTFANGNMAYIATGLAAKM